MLVDVFIYPEFRIVEPAMATSGSLAAGVSKFFISDPTFPSPTQHSRSPLVWNYPEVVPEIFMHSLFCGMEWISYDGSSWSSLSGLFIA